MFVFFLVFSSLINFCFNMKTKLNSNSFIPFKAFCVAYLFLSAIFTSFHFKCTILILSIQLFSSNPGVSPLNVLLSTRCDFQRQYYIPAVIT